MDLRATLKLAHFILSQNKIPHALIGGLALACYGSTRATVDLDLLVREEDKERLKTLFHQNGFNLINESDEVLQFSGMGYVDILLARRPISQRILQEAGEGGLEGIPLVKVEDLIGLKIQAYKNDKSRTLQDKADIQFLIENVKNLDWKKIQEYANLFDEWEAICEIKNQINS